MQLAAATFKPCTAGVAARKPGASRWAIVVRAHHGEEEAVSRRATLSGLAVLPVLLTAAPAFAFGKDVRQAMKDKEARKQKLRESAAKMKANRKTDAAFQDSKYSLPEDATTPNMRTLANDRLRKED